MIILWIRKRGEEEPEEPSPDGKDSFQEHHEMMRKFRLAHPQGATAPQAKPAPQDILNADGNLLAPISSVRLGANQQN